MLVIADRGCSEPAIYVVPSEDWRDAAPPLTYRDYEGRASDPDYGIEIVRSSLPSLRRYAWTEAAARDCFGLSTQPLDAQDGTTARMGCAPGPEVT
jgi:hypothetical protein